MKSLVPIIFLFALGLGSCTPKPSAQSATDSPALATEGESSNPSSLTSPEATENRPEGVDVLSGEGETVVRYEVSEINIDGLSISSPYEESVIEGNIGEVKVAAGGEANYPIYLVDKDGEIKAVSQYFSGERVVKFSPLESAKTAVLISPFVDFSTTEEGIAYRELLSSKDYAKEIEAIARQQEKDGDLFSGDVIDMAMELGAKITETH